MKLNKYCFFYSDNDLGIIYNSLNNQTRILSTSIYDSIINEHITDKNIIQDLENNLFFEKNIPDNICHTLHNSAQDRKNKSKILKARILTTTKCNARCFYCYEEGITPVSLNESKSDAIVNYLIHTITTYQYDTLDIEWFGGEPLVNFDSIKYISSKIQKLMPHITFLSKIVSNGYLITEDILDYLIKNCHLRAVQITLDGTKEKYERIKKLGPDSFDIVLDNIKRITDHNLKMLIRINYDDYNIDDVISLLEYLGQQPFASKILIGCAPIFNDKIKKDCITTKEKYSEKILYAMYKNGFVSLKNILPNRMYFPCIAKSSHYLSFYPDGRIFGCDRSFSDKNVLDNYLSPKYELKKISCFCQDSVKCMECKFFPICFGGCEYERTIGKSGCEYNDKIMTSYLKICLKIYKDLVTEK